MDNKIEIGRVFVRSNGDNEDNAIVWDSVANVNGDWWRTWWMMRCDDNMS